jgi:hypothetical protein
MDGFFAKLTCSRLKRGVFHSTVDLQAINSSCGLSRTDTMATVCRNTLHFDKKALSN